ncbi:hypothetical protein VP1G_10348 [Cytospora mali]|uniref:Integral membrane protein n=1 Tax=Cytospora mali TaxID=578113 RepID=A0A194VH60_CYTMA|nr:hypothetical protein VP1G_10348 [Valsa mali var. pyri (nom. inval.)]
MTDHATDHFRGRHYTADHISGPIAFLNPTTRLLPIQKAKPKPTRGDSTGPQPDDNAKLPTSEGPAAGTDQQKPSHSPSPSSPHHPAIYHIWRSRDNRKGRHALALTPSTVADPTVSTTHQPTNTLKATLAGLTRMALRYPIWDVSYDVAAIFTLGSVVWVINGFFVLLPMTNPADTWGGESLWGGGVTAMVGATIFEVGSVFLMLEAVNENRSECFGWALEEALSHGKGDLVLRKDSSGCRHHHQDRKAWLSKKSVADDTPGSDEDAAGLVDEEGKRNGGDSEEGGASRGKGRRRWTWWPSWYELRTHYVRDIGFLACLSQMIGATIFWIAGFTGLPQIIGVLTVPATNGIYWLPQVVGGTGFIVSSFLFMLETQPNWYTPELRTLGWHIGFWNLVGAIGFTLCGALGFGESNEGCEVALTWSTFIGSWAFLIGSVIQWYESLDKYPVAVGKVAGLKEDKS